MATWNSSSYSGRYLQLTITEEVDVINNRSKLNWTLKSIGGSSNYYSTGPTTVIIAGKQVYYKARTDWSSKVFPAAKGSVSGSLYVTHDSNGKKTISASFSTAIYTATVSSYGGNITLTNIDRTAPTVKHSVSNIKADGFKITVTSSAQANKWWYSLNGGSTWTLFSSTAATSRDVVVTGLTANTTYSLVTCARKTYNNVDGYSAKTNVKTLGASVISSVNSVDADAETVSIKANITVYESTFYHKLILSNGTSDMITINVGQLSAGKTDRTFSLTEEQRNTLLKNISGKTLEGKLQLKTYTSSNYSTQVGNTSSCNCTFATDAETSGPIFEGFSYKDTKEEISDIVGTDQILLQNYSFLQVLCSDGVAKNGATISSYSASIGGSSATSTGTILDVGAISTEGELEITVSCTDSRGYSASIKKTIKVLPYSKPKITACRARRKDEVEPLVQLSFSGSFSAIQADGETNTNSITRAGFFYKETNAEEYSSFVSLIEDITVQNTNFEFSSDELIELDENKSYNLHILVQDKLGALTSCDLYVVLAQGTPIIALRKRNATYNYPRVGINNPNPTEALDVAGNIKMNGFLVQGFIKDLGNTERLNDIKAGGIYMQPFSASAKTENNYPEGKAGFLEVIASASENVLQRYTTYDGTCVYVRTFYSYVEVWGEWYKLLLS